MNKTDQIQLTQWFQSQKRDLPWRDEPTPYKVWVSEVMLQQTRVAVVIPYFERWMERFPTIQELAKAPIEEVIKLWEGLGYYSRARRLHEGAIYLCSRFGGEFPTLLSDWQSIKGLGPYTIGAIRSFAFHEKCAAVDGNVMRVLARYHHLTDDFAKAATSRRVWELASESLPDEEHWVHNEALIELGATSCGRIPKCFECPIRKGCLAHAKGVAANLPINSRKIPTTVLHRAVAIVYSSHKVLISQVEAGKVMAGLHEFPYVELESDQIENAADLLQKDLKLSLEVKAKLPKLVHSFTRYRANLFPFIFEVDGEQERALKQKGYRWVAKEELASLAFSSGHKRILQELKK